MDHPLDKARTQGHALCRELGIEVHPYGAAWWLLGTGVNRVVSDLAGLSRSDVSPLPIFDR